MENQFEYLRITRNNCLRLISRFSNEQLNKIPEGFSNNLIWNVGHMVVTQQLLQYSLSGNTPILPQEIIDRYRKGTRPEGIVSDEEISQIKTWMISTADQLEKDYNEGKFTSYKEYTTSYGSTLKSIDEAITFNNIHEGLHLGYSMSLCKLI